MPWKARITNHTNYKIISVVLLVATIACGYLLSLFSHHLWLPMLSGAVFGVLQGRLNSLKYQWIDGQLMNRFTGLPGPDRRFFCWRSLIVVLLYLLLLAAILHRHYHNDFGSRLIAFLIPYLCCDIGGNALIYIPRHGQINLPKDQ